MIKQCKICGNDFEAQQSNYIICSQECRKINKANYRKNYDEKTREYRLQYQREYGRKHKRKEVKCGICGNVVKHTFNSDGRMVHYRYHAECVLNDAIARFNELGKWVQTDTRIHRSINYGYTKSEVMKLMQEK